MPAIIGTHRVLLGTSPPPLAPNQTGSTLLAWWRADLGVFTDDAATTPAVATNDHLAVWQDQSGNGYHATQTSDAARPLYQAATNGINSREAALWNSTGSIMLVNALGAALAGTDAAVAVFAVTKAVNTGGTFTLFSASLTTGTATGRSLLDVELRSGGATYRLLKTDDAGSSQNRAGGLPNTSAHTPIYNHPGTAATIYVDGVNVVSGSLDVGTVTFDQAAIGAVQLRNLSVDAEAQWANARIAELALFSTTLSLPSINGLLSYAKTRYGITVTYV